jgi:syntaxin 1B/2/3
MDVLIHHINVTTSYIEDLENLKPEIKREYDRLLYEPNVDNSKEIAKINKKRYELTQNIKRELDIIDKIQINHKQTKEIMTHDMRLLFSRVIKDFENLQNDFKRREKDIITRKYRIVNPLASDDEIDEQVKLGNTRLFDDKIANNTLSYIRKRHDEIIKLDQSVTELHQLFTDMSVLVEAQSSVIDNIESNVVVTNSNVEKGTEDLKQAGTFQKKSRKKMFIILGIIIAVIVISVVIVVIIVA